MSANEITKQIRQVNIAWNKVARSKNQDLNVILVANR